LEPHALPLLETKTLIFIAGAEGSGTSVLRRLLAAPDCCASLGQNFSKLPDHPEARRLFAEFVDASARLWDRTAPLSARLKARCDWHSAAERIGVSRVFSDRTHLVLKRSFPFGVPHGIGSPDLWDVLDLFADTRIVVIYREPCAAVYSAFRRGFDSDLRRLAVMCAEQLTRLAAYAQTIDTGLMRIISYGALCKAPDATLKPLSAFAGIPFDAISDAVRKERIMTDTDRRYASELPRSDVTWLERFFDARRRRQWEKLELSSLFA
jgi:hypothetical protein